jgi:ribosomal protein S18 acetylase RimI-like enzyme
MSPCDITLREAGEADRPFLLELYASTREAEMAMVPWPEPQKRAFVGVQFAAQLRGYAESHPGAVHRIILAAGEPAGRIYLDRGEREIHILDITVAPAFRNSGIGSAVLREVLAEADRTGKTAGIFVEDFNPSRRLFERLGFSVAERDGFLLRLQYRPVAAIPQSLFPDRQNI